MTVSIVYVAAPDRESAAAVGRALVEERLAAGANILPEMTSIFRWDGEIDEANEAVLIVKTRSELVETVIARIRELHRYDCPGIVAWPVCGGNAAYLDWVCRETEPI